MDDRVDSERAEVEDAIFGVLRVSYLRLLGVRADDLATQNLALAEHFASIESDKEALMVVFDHHRRRAVEYMHERLHAAPNVDHEMLDESMEFELRANPRED